MNLWSKSVWIFTIILLSFCGVYLYPNPTVILFVTGLLSVLIVLQAVIILRDEGPQLAEAEQSTHEQLP